MIHTHHSIPVFITTLLLPFNLLRFLVTFSYHLLLPIHSIHLLLSLIRQLFKQLRLFVLLPSPIPLTFLMAWITRTLLKSFLAHLSARITLQLGPQPLDIRSYSTWHSIGMSLLYCSLIGTASNWK